MNKYKRGFTLVEVLVVVLIIGILAAIAVPSYNYAVEKSRASYAITSLKQIAKAQTAYNARVGNYSTEAKDLTLDMKDSDGTIANGNEFTDKFFNYEIFGDDEVVSVARRNNGEYELSIDYATGKLYCSPADHKICRDLNLEEGRSVSGWPRSEDCDIPDGYISCVNTLYKSGASNKSICKEDKSCEVTSFDSDGQKQKTYQISNDYWNTFYIYIYNPPGSNTWTKRGYRNGNLFFEEIVINGSTQYSFAGNMIDYRGGRGYASYWNTTFNATAAVCTEHRLGANIATKQYYDSDGQITKIDYLSNNNITATVNYAKDGTITSSECFNNCDNWAPAERSTLKYADGAPPKPTDVYCESNPDDEVMCGE